MILQLKYIEDLILLLEQQGFNTNKHIFKPLGLKQGKWSLNDTITIGQFNNIVKRVTEETGFNDMAIIHGEAINMRKNRFLLHILYTSVDLEGLLRKISFYPNILHPLIHFNVQKEGKIAYLEFHTDDTLLNKYPDAYRYIVESQLVFTLRSLQRLSSFDIYPLEAYLSFSEKFNSRELTRLLQSEIFNNADYTCLSYELKDLQYKNIMFKEHFTEQIKYSINNLVQSMPEQKTFSTKIYKDILEAFRYSQPQIERIASKYHYEAKTVTQKLREEGTNYQQLLNNAMKEIADSLQKHTNFSPEQVAYILGFSDEATFMQSYKRWSGKSFTKKNSGTNSSNPQ